MYQDSSTRSFSYRVKRRTGAVGDAVLESAFQAVTAKPLDASMILHSGRSVTMLDGQIMDAYFHGPVGTVGLIGVILHEVMSLSRLMIIEDSACASVSTEE